MASKGFRTPIVAIAIVLASGFALRAQEIGPETNRPLPRFVTMAADEVNVRVGPGEQYDIRWIYVRRGYPVEITQEFDIWRRIRDIDGDQGWVHYGMLSGERNAMVVSPAGDRSPLPIRRTPGSDATVALLEPGVIARLERCQQGWCRLADDHFSGWIEQDLLWGAYPGEEL